MRITLRQRIRSIGYAWQGLKSFFVQEPNAVIHLIATLLVAVLATVAGVSTMEGLALIIVTGFVWVAELFNSAIEKAMDFITRERHSSVKFVKDVAAAAVLVAAIIALLTGGIVFIPKIISICQR